MKKYNIDPNNPRSFYLTEDENQRIFQEVIIPKLKKRFDFTPKENPYVYITGGLPGAGKTASIDNFKQESKNSKILIINSDNMRIFHPLYSKAMELYGSNAGSAIHKDASIFAQKLIEYAQKERIDFIVDTTLRDSTQAKNLISSLQKNQYNIVVNMLAVNKYESIQGVFNRYAKQYKNKPETARFVNPKYIDEAIPEIIKSAEVVEKENVTEFKIYNRNNELLYDSKSDKNKSVADIIKRDTNLKNWNSERIANLIELWNNTIENLQNANAPQDIIDMAKSIYREFNQKIYQIALTKSLSSNPYDNLKPNPEYFQLSVKERVEYFKEVILPTLKLERFQKKEVATSFFTGGIPGSGKGRLVANWNKDNDKLVIDADKLREKHPFLDTIAYIYKSEWGTVTHPDASAWANMLKKHSEEIKIDYILDGSLKNAKNAVSKITDAIKNGNRVVVSIMAANIYEAYQGVLNRYLKQYNRNKESARYVPLSILESAYKSIPNTLDELEKLNLDNFTIVDRDLNIIFDSKKDKNPKNHYLEFGDISNYESVKLQNMLDEFEKLKEKILTIENSEDIINDIDNITTKLKIAIDNLIVKGSSIDKKSGLNLFDEMYQEYIEKKLKEQNTQLNNLTNKEVKKSDTDNKIDDFGEKIGGARKDLYKNLEFKDIESLNEFDVKKFLNKHNIWESPKYENLYNNGYSAKSAYFIKKIYTATPSTIRTAHYSNLQIKEDFYNFVQDMKNIVNNIPTNLEPKEISLHILNELAKRDYFEKKNNQYYITEKFNRLHHNKYINKTLINRLTFKLDKKTLNELSNIQWDNLLSKKSMIKRNSNKTEIRKLEYLEEYIRKSDEDYRNGKDITVEDFWNTFKFRAGEFGNYLSQKERQKILNATYDALLDLSKALNLHPEAIGLNGNLAIAFGSRGKGGIGAPNAHYEPSRMVINLTKYKGGGSLAHEWFHALDNYIDAQARGKNRSIAFSTQLSSSSKYQDFNTNKEYIAISSSLMAISSLAKYKSILSTAFNQAQINNVVKEVMYNIGRINKAKDDAKFKRKDKSFYQMRFETLEENYGKSDFYKNSLELDRNSKKIYWSKDIEMMARAFEVYVLDKLEEKNIRNDFLVNPKKNDKELFIKHNTHYPYPANNDRQTINNALDITFEQIAKSNILTNKLEKSQNIDKEKKTDKKVDRSKENRYTPSPY